MEGQVIKINDGVRERVIGTYYPDNNTFYKEVNEAKHLFKKMDAWGTDAKYLEEVLVPKNARIVIFDRDNMVAYSVSAEDLKKKGQYFHFKTANAGTPTQDHRTQIFLARVHFQQKKIEPKPTAATI